MDVMDFIELEGFIEEWMDLGLNDEDLQEVQITIMADPSRWPIVKGTGGSAEAAFRPDTLARGQAG